MRHLSMFSRFGRFVVPFVMIAVLLSRPLATANAAPPKLDGKDVLDAIDRATRFLTSVQKADGSWGDNQFKTGVTALAVLALLNAGMDTDDAPVRRGLTYLRNAEEPTLTYEVSLSIMVYATAKDGNRDLERIIRLARKLQAGQIDGGDNRGSWDYHVKNGGFLKLGGDRSNGQFAILGLREAAYAGVPIDRKVWELAEGHWKRSQNADGGWSYSGLGGGGSYGSMTAAGVSSLVITESMLLEDRDGPLRCCDAPATNEELEKGIRWLARNFRRGDNPGRSGWLLYYLYGIERAGRLSGRRFFGDHDWYREITEYLLKIQNKRTGSFQGVGNIETRPEVGTSFALLFLSKGLSPVLINKLEYGTEDPRRVGEVADGNWRQHANDARNIVQHISGLPKWPKLLTHQVVNIKKVMRSGGVEDLLQSPVLYISGRSAPEFTDDEIEMLREYVAQGGFIFAAGNCDGDFDAGFRRVVRRMYPDDDIIVQPLEDNHPIFRAEYLLSPESVPLEGADFGCRTAIVLAPRSMELACLWDNWTVNSPRNRPDGDKMRIEKGMRVGVNVIAYATGREPPKKLDPETQLVDGNREDAIERGLLQVAKLRHGGGWDTAPQALPNLLRNLNQAVGPVASPTVRNLPATDPNLYKYPLIYMHGRNSFRLSAEEKRRLKAYLENGGVLFADACCGAKTFDSAFRDLIKELFPEQKFERIPVDSDPEQSHELFTTEVGYDLRTVKRRAPEIDDPDEVLETDVRVVEPYLEGIKLENRYAVIYSKYDISCALQRQGSVACAGYTQEDAARIATNVILYAMLQDIDAEWFERAKSE